MPATDRRPRRTVPARRPGGGEGGRRTPILPDLEENISRLHDLLGRSTPDLVVRRFAGAGITRGALMYFDGMVNVGEVGNNLLRPLLASLRREDPAAAVDVGATVRDILRSVITTPEGRQIATLEVAVRHLLDGKVLLLLAGTDRAVSLGVSTFPTRAPEEPAVEQVVRGPHEGFTERLRTNLVLLRRRLKTHDLRVEQVRIGRRTNTDVAICYLRGVARPDLVAEVRRRLRSIDVDGILAAGMVEELIHDHPLSPFPTVMVTERPDKIAGLLLEGRVAIIIDGTPVSIAVPVQFWAFLQAPDDYYGNWIAASFVRYIRLGAFLVTLLLPGLYVAATTFHHEMLPTPLALSIAGGREGVPFPALVEALGMELAFEVIREAGLRIPRPIGPAITIVGTLVIGEAAVAAGVVSPIMIMVVGVTAIAGFAIPSPTAAESLRLLRFPVMILAGLLGFYGIAWALIALLLHLVSLRSFGFPYLAPLGPLYGRDLKDIIMRFPLWKHDRRPHLISRNRRRQAPGQQPSPPPGREPSRRRKGDG